MNTIIDLFNDHKSEVSGYYQHIYFPDVLPSLLKQGFGVDK